MKAVQGFANSESDWKSLVEGEETLETINVCATGQCQILGGKSVFLSQHSLNLPPLAMKAGLEVQSRGFERSEGGFVRNRLCVSLS